MTLIRKLYEEEEGIINMAMFDNAAQQEEKLNGYYAALGELYIENSRGDLPAEYRGIYEQILQSKKRIREAKALQQTSVQQQNHQQEQQNAQASVHQQMHPQPQPHPHPSMQGTAVYPYLTEEQLPAKFKPVKAWSYFGWTVVFTIPLIGWIIALIKAFGNTENVNLQNFARSMFCYFVIVVILWLLVVGMASCTAGLII